MRSLALMYHRVNTLEHDPFTICVSPKCFDEQLQAIRSLNIPASITFDDGYADNLENALPLLEKHELPATIFVTSGMVGSEFEMWWDELERKYLTGIRADWDWDEDDPGLGASRFRELFRQYRLQPFAIYEDRPDARLNRRMLSKTELRALAVHPLITIGAHCITHPVLSSLTYERQKWEIEESKRQLQEITSCEITEFAYPNGGKSDYTEETVQLVREAGFARAYAAWDGIIDGQADRYQLPRVMVRDWSGDVFASVLNKKLSI